MFYNEGKGDFFIQAKIVSIIILFLMTLFFTHITGIKDANIQCIIYYSWQKFLGGGRWIPSVAVEQNAYVLRVNNYNNHNNHISFLSQLHALIFI